MQNEDCIRERASFKNQISKVNTAESDFTSVLARLIARYHVNQVRKTVSKSGCNGARKSQAKENADKDAK